jgi:hypothetical protein
LNHDLKKVIQHRPRYYSYLLRLWLPGDEGEVSWRASLDDPRTGERLGFSSLEALFIYLQEQVNLDTEAEK